MVAAGRGEQEAAVLDQGERHLDRNEDEGEEGDQSGQGNESAASHKGEETCVENATQETATHRDSLVEHRRRVELGETRGTTACFREAIEDGKRPVSEEEEQRVEEHESDDLA